MVEITEELTGAVRGVLHGRTRCRSSGTASYRRRGGAAEPSENRRRPARARVPTRSGEALPAMGSMTVSALAALAGAVPGARVAAERRIAAIGRLPDGEFGERPRVLLPFRPRQRGANQLVDALDHLRGLQTANPDRPAPSPTFRRNRARSPARLRMPLRPGSGSVRRGAARGRWRVGLRHARPGLPCRAPTSVSFFRRRGALPPLYACSASHVVQRVCLTSSSIMATTAWFVTRRSRGQ